ncbi:hypothetical protein DL546_003678 [Coniochaeta pulveracea]|uniref:Uncharacterized protein n=1 Tax=Coniochaeta pulveracea TaxID=177199 RepID=A0A420Y3Y3_9PEZI|nr:hypothetical protein DL546_003678 [Coniochaeta pulveracea]
MDPGIIIKHNNPSREQQFLVSTPPHLLIPQVKPIHSPYSSTMGSGASKAMDPPRTLGYRVECNLYDDKLPGSHIRRPTILQRCLDKAPGITAGLRKQAKSKFPKFWPKECKNRDNLFLVGHHNLPRSMSSPT